MSEQDTLQGAEEERGTPGEKVGAYLKARREARGLSLDEVAAQTRIKRGYLEAIEADDYEALPSGPFVSGFIASYARTLGIDPSEIEPLIPELEPPPIVDPAVRQDPEWKGPPLEIRELPVGGRGGTLSAWGIALAVTLLVVAVVVFLTPSLRSLVGVDRMVSTNPAPADAEPSPAGETVSPSDSPDASEKATVTAPAESDAKAAASPDAGEDSKGAKVSVESGDRGVSTGEKATASGEDLAKRRIRRLASIVGADDRTYVVYTDDALPEGKEQEVEIVARYKTYLRVSKTLDGKPVFEDILPKGKSKRFTRAGDLWVVIGNSGGVEIYYDGTRLPPPGKFGEKKGIAFRW